MASEEAKYEYDAIIIHGDDEIDQARNFCDIIRDNVDLDQQLKIKTFEDFSHPGKTEIQNLEDAVNAANVIFCSENYYHTDSFGKFQAQVAIREKLPDKMVKISTGRTENKTAVMRTFRGITLDENWGVDAPVLENLRKLFRDNTRNTAANLDTGFSDLDPNMDQLSISKSSSQSSLLSVANPSVVSTDINRSNINSRSAHEMLFKQAPSILQRQSTPIKPASERRCEESADLPCDDLEEDAEPFVPLPSVTNNGDAPIGAKRTYTDHQMASSPAHHHGHSGVNAESPPVLAASEGNGEWSTVKTVAAYCIAVIFAVVAFLVDRYFIQ